MFEFLLFIVVLAVLGLFFLRVIVKYLDCVLNRINASFLGEYLKNIHYVKLLYYGGWVITIFGCLVLCFMFDINLSIFENVQASGYYIFILWGYFVIFRGCVSPAHHERDILNIDDAFLKKFKDFFMYSTIFWTCMLILTILDF